MLEGHITCTGKMKNTYEILLRKSQDRDVAIDIMAM